MGLLSEGFKAGRFVYVYFIDSFSEVGDLGEKKCNKNILLEIYWMSWKLYELRTEHTI